ncbi:MAG: hypothetical protein U0Q16_01520 [Bryobacteraceae bacterium]
MLSGPAVQRIEQSQITEVILTNSIPLSREAARSSQIQTFRWLRCWPRPSNRFTKRLRSARCSYEFLLSNQNGHRRGQPVPRLPS